MPYFSLSDRRIYSDQGQRAAARGVFHCDLVLSQIVSRALFVYESVRESYQACNPTLNPFHILYKLIQSLAISYIDLYPIHNPTRVPVKVQLENANSVTLSTRSVISQLSDRQPRSVSGDFPTNSNYTGGNEEANSTIPCSSIEEPSVVH